MKGPRKTYTKDEQLPIRFTAENLRRADEAAGILSERDGELVTKTEVLRDGGNRYVEEILAGHHANPTPLPNDRRHAPRRRAPRRATDPDPIKKSA